MRSAYSGSPVIQPFYARGKRGIVERCSGDIANPEELAYGRAGHQDQEQRNRQKTGRKRPDMACAPPGYWLLSTTSPPPRVANARQVAWSMVLATNRTEPSDMAALTPPVW